jgi:hypothetical protein
MEIKSYDPSTIALLRRAFDDVAADQHVKRKVASPLEIAEHILAQAAKGERDIDRLKASAYRKFGIPTSGPSNRG